MGKRGKRPEPTVLKIARGNPGKRPINDREPKPTTSNISPPDWITGKSLDNWHSLLPIVLNMGVMTDADVATFARYCFMLEQYVKYVDQVRRGLDVLVMRDESGRVKYMQSAPAATMMMKLDSAMLRIEQEFGLTPSARTGITAAGAQGGDDLERFLAEHA